MGTVLYRDFTALSGIGTTVTLAAADACAACIAGGSHGGVFAGNGDATGISAIAIFIVALAAAGDGDVVGVAAICNGTADARAARAAVGSQAAGLAVPSGLVLKGQGVICVITAVFLQRRMALAAGQGVAAVQLQRHIALGVDGGLAGVAGVDVHLVQRNRCGNALLGVDGRRVGRLGAIAGQGDRRFVLIVVQLDIIAVLHKAAVRSLLGDISAIALGVHGHTALGQVVGVRKGCCGDGRDHCQKRGGGKRPQGQLSIGIDSHAWNLLLKN